MLGTGTPSETTINLARHTTVNGPIKKLVRLKTTSKEASMREATAAMLGINIDQHEFAEALANSFLIHHEKEVNYWSDIASIICCSRSSVYLRSLTRKV